MILQPGTWLGRGAFRPVGETLNSPLEARIQITEEQRGWLLKAELELGDNNTMRFTGWIFADEFGTYTISVRFTLPSTRDSDGEEISVTGIAKLESTPHLGLLWSEDGQSHVAFTVFRLKDTDGIRGFAKLPRVTLTWELALRPEHQAGLGGNVVAFKSR